MPLPHEIGQGNFCFFAKPLYKQKKNLLQYIRAGFPVFYIGGFLMTWFNRQSRLVQLLLLIIPFVNWITEVLVRWSTFLKKGGIIRLVICLIVTFAGGLIIGWLDFIWVLLFKKLFLQ